MADQTSQDTVGEAAEVPLAVPAAAATRRSAPPRSLPANAGPRAPLVSEIEWVVLDTETTGFGPEAHLVELAAVRLSSTFVVQGVFSSLVRPPLPIPTDASAIHGIQDTHVAEAPSAMEVIPAFLDFARGAVLVAHNAAFDQTILDAESHRSPRPTGFAPEAIVDTLKLARWAFPGLSSYTLGNLREVLDLDGWDLAADEPDLARRVGLREAHRALPDALAAAKLFVRALEVVPGLATGALDALVDPPVDVSRATGSSGERARADRRRAEKTKPTPVSPGIAANEKPPAQLLLFGPGVDAPPEPNEHQGTLFP